MPRIVIFSEASDSLLAESLRSDLVAREWAVRIDGFASNFLNTGFGPSDDYPALAILPREERTRDVCIEKVDLLLASGMSVLLLVPESFSAPLHLYNRGLRGVISTVGMVYDRIFEEVFKFSSATMPSWIDVRIRPSQIYRPTGVSWWTEDVYVADERYEHVVRIGPTESSVVVPGLCEPHHINLDRRSLTIANKAADEIIYCSIADDMATDVQALTSVNSLPLKRPHDAKCAHFAMAVADTDNHRVIFSPHTNSIRMAKWQVLEPSEPFRAPCGVFVDRKIIWVADTFNHRIVAFDHVGGQIFSAGSFGDGDLKFKYPVAIQIWNDFVFIADEQNECLHVYRQELNPSAAPLLYLGKLAEGIIKQPFGLSVNRENRLAVGDRKQKCVWLVDLRSAMKDLLSRG